MTLIFKFTVFLTHKDVQAHEYPHGSAHLAVYLKLLQRPHDDAHDSAMLVKRFNRVPRVQRL